MTEYRNYWIKAETAEREILDIIAERVVEGAQETYFGALITFTSGGDIFTVTLGDAVKAVVTQRGRRMIKFTSDVVQ